MNPERYVKSVELAVSRFVDYDDLRRGRCILSNVVKDAVLNYT